MKCCCSQSQLVKALALVGHAVATTSSLPVLKHLLLEVEDGLRVRGTNLEIDLQVHVPAGACVPGAYTVPAKLFSDFVAGLQGDVTLERVKNALVVTDGGGRANIRGIEAEEFPTPSAISGPTYTLDGETLKGLIDRVAFAAANDKSRPVLNCVLWEVGDGLRLVAADGFRMALDGETQPEQVLLPAATMGEVRRIAEGAVTLTVGSSAVQFASEVATLRVQRGEGAFPAYGQILPKEHTNRLRVETNALLRAVRNAELFAKSGAHIVKLNAMGGMHTVEGESSEYGEATTPLPAEGELHTQLNALYLIAALGAIPSAQVWIETQEVGPVVLRPAFEDDPLRQLVMPMSVR